MVEGYAVPVLSIRERVSFDTPALSPSSRKLRTRFLRRVLSLRTLTSTSTVYITCTISANNEYTFQVLYRLIYTKLILIWYNRASVEKGPASALTPRDPAHRERKATVDERILAQRAQHSPTDQEHKGGEESNCFYCLSGWVFLGSLDHDGEEIVEAIRCRRCKGTSRISC